MRDKATQLALRDQETRRICGHTRIILTDVKTGKQKVVEHKNTFQSAYLTSYLRGLGLANNSPFNNSTWRGRPLWRNMCGGILLFRDAITAPAEYAPATNLMVGNGAYGVSNSGTPTELGSYNSIESATGGASSLTFVYDWGTSQGNGTIGCVCLTSETGGYIGYGNASGASATLRSIIENQESNYAGAHAYYNGQRIRIVDVDYSTKKITVAKSNDCVTVASIFEGQNEETTEISYSGTPLGNGSTNIFYRAASDSEIFVFKSSSADAIPSGSSGGLLFYNFKTDTAQVITINNTSGQQITPYRTTSQVGVTRDTAGNIYIAGQGSDLVQFDSSGAYVKTFTGLASSLPTFGMLTPSIPFAAAGNSAPINMIYGADARPTNGSTPSALTHFPEIDALCRQYEGRANVNTGDLMPYKNPLYLATINNLETAITKDSTQTMKIIYTLTEASS
jgi:hypothetical protein